MCIRDRNKVIYSNIQPNTKEAGIWINTNDGNVKIEKDGKWIDDGGSGSSDGAKWEYYKIDRGNTSYDNDAMWNVFYNVTLTNQKNNGMLYILPRGESFNEVAAIAGISFKSIVDESEVDTGSWLGNIKEWDKLNEFNYDYSFLIPITEEEFFSDNFDYPIVES